MPPDFLTRDNAHFVQAEALPLTIHQAVAVSPPAPSFADPSDAVTCTSFARTV